VKDSSGIRLAQTATTAVPGRRDLLRSREFIVKYRKKIMVAVAVKERELLG
jgi:hypothetical protein